jgi:hypothetical protein
MTAKYDLHGRNLLSILEILNNLQENEPMLIIGVFFKNLKIFLSRITRILRGCGILEKIFWRNCSFGNHGHGMDRSICQKAQREAAQLLAIRIQGIFFASRADPTALAPTEFFHRPGRVPYLDHLFYLIVSIHGQSVDIV